MLFTFFLDGIGTPGLAGVAPQNLSFPPRLRSNESNTSVIIIEWGVSPSDIPQSVVYEVQYTLNPLDGAVVSDMMIVSGYVCLIHVSLPSFPVTRSLHFTLHDHGLYTYTCALQSANR